MKTYSVAIQNNKGEWITNWRKFKTLNDVDWNEVEEFCRKRLDIAYGYYYGHKSNELTSARCRTIKKIIDY